MPELPEVETIVRELHSALAGKSVRRVVISDRTLVGNLSPAAFIKKVEGAKIGSLARRGKYVVFYLKPASRGVVAFHPRMTGAPQWARRSAPFPDHLRGYFALGAGELRFVDTRRFARLYWFPSSTAFDIDRALGPEPFAMSAADFQALLGRHPKRRIKDFLLDQKIIAGVGNIYSDEALWAAKIHPFRKAETLTKAEADILFRALLQVLRRAVRAGGTSFRDYRTPSGVRGGFHPKLLVYNREGQPCKRCGTPLVRRAVGSRGTRFCIQCQKIKN